MMLPLFDQTAGHYQGQQSNLATLSMVYSSSPGGATASSPVLGLSLPTTVLACADQLIE
jgi:hypothetical protein